MSLDTTTIDTVRQIMGDTFGVPPEELPDDVSSDTYERWSSLYHITLLAALEDHYGHTFSMEEMTTMTSLPSIVSVIEARDR